MATDSMRKTVIVGEGQPLCRRGLAAMLQFECGFDEVAEAEDFQSVLALVEREPDARLVTIDSALPGLRGMTDLRSLRLAHPELCIVVVSSLRDRSIVLDALAAGAHGFVPKEFSAPDMVRAFKIVEAGGVFVPPTVTDVAAPQRPPSQNFGRGTDLLTDRQREVLAQLVTGKTNKEIAKALRIAESTVKVHVTAAFRLLGVQNRAGAVAVLESGSRSSVREAKAASFVGNGRRFEDRAHAEMSRTRISMPLFR